MERCAATRCAHAVKYVGLTLENIPYAAQLGKELYSLGAFNMVGPEFDWDFTIRSLRYAMDDPMRYLRFAVDDDGTFTGGVFGHVASFFCSPKLMGIEDGWYVREGTPYRARVAMTLMRGFVDWALDEKGALLVQSGDVAAINSHAVDTLYRHMGFTRFGTI